MRKRKESKITVQSTQQNIPIQDFSDGIVITKDGQYIKVIEVLPVPFFLKKPSEQNKICGDFENLLKASPGYLHFKSMAIPADLSKQIQDVEQSIECEDNYSCSRMGKEYKETLLNGQKYGITRKFYISFPYIGKNKSDYDEIVNSLNTDALRMSTILSGAGNSVRESDTDNPDEANMRIFYMLYNRNRFLENPLESRINEINAKYRTEQGENREYVPATDYIAPEKIIYSSARYLIVDDTYYSFLYIPSYGYNEFVYTGCFDPIVNSFNGVDVDIFIKRMPKELVLKSIRRNLASSQVTLWDANNNSDSHDKSLNALGSGQYLKEGLQSGQDLYYMSTIITISGRSIDEVERKKEEIKKLGRQMNIVLRENVFECESTFNAVLPTSQFDEKFMSKMKRNVLTEGVAATYLFTTFQMIDSNGVYIADDNGGSPVIIDMFNRQRFTNPHIFICGETGAGKTIALLLIALRARIKHVPVYILAPEKQDEFRRVCDAIGGQFVSIGAGSKDRINIMDIFVPSWETLEKQKLIDGVSSFEMGSFLSEKMATLMEFLQLHITDISSEEKQLLNEAIEKTYQIKGITKDNSSLWEDKEKTKLREMPVLMDLINELDKHQETKRLARIIRLLTHGTGEHFNGKTNVNIDNSFFVIGLEHNTEEMLGLSIYMAMDYCWSRIKSDRTRNKFLIIDEWWKLAFNPIAAAKSLEISKIARALGCSFVIATQQMSDILAFEEGKYGNAVLNNCATKILMSMKEKDVYSVKEMVGLTNSECSKILRFKPGEGLLIAGDNRLTLKFNPSETETLLTFTDKETLERYVKLKHEEELAMIEFEKYEILDDRLISLKEICEMEIGEMINLDEWKQSLLLEGKSEL